jgi:hypothetical protein
MVRLPRILALLLPLVAVALPAPAGANSVFSVGGLGEPQLEEPARLRALGGAGAAERGPRAFSLVNPATMADAEHLLFEGTILPVVRRVQARSFPEETGAETTIPSLRMVIALPGGVVLGGSYLSGTNAQFRVDHEDSADTPSSLHIDGSGGINFVRVSLARRMSPALALGVDCDVASGSYREEWLRTFQDATLAQSRDTLEVDYGKRARWRLGALATRRGYSVGAVFESERALPLRVSQRTAGASVTQERGSLTLPAGFTIGASAPLGERGRAVAQYRRAGWGRSSLRSDLVDFRAQERWSVGFERGHAAEGGGRGLARLPLRAGAYHLRWPDLLPIAGSPDIAGGSAGVSEWALTLGTGIRSRDRGGAVDVSLEAGSRGSIAELGARERFVRLGISLQVSDDTWKGSFH